MSKFSSLPAEPFDSFEGQAQVEPGTPAWKQEVNQRLAAHRTRRAASPDARDQRPESTRTASSRAAEAAARVAARYAKAPSYSQLLAGEARAVVRAAGAAAEAARNAQAAAEAVLAGLETPGLWDDVAPETGFAAQFEAEPQFDSGPQLRMNPYVSEERAVAGEPVASSHIVQSRWHDEAPVVAQPIVQSAPWAGAQPRWEEALPVTAPAPAAGRDAGHDIWSEMRVHPAVESAHAEENELFAYDRYVAHDPVGSATVDPVQHLPANLIEFPRELVAAKKSRPRLAEGPLYAEEPSPQLNIFEVDLEVLAPPIYLSSAAMDTVGSVAPPEWASIELDHPAEYDYADHVAEHAYAPKAVALAAAAYAPALYATAPVAAVAAPADEAAVVRESYRAFQQSKEIAAEAAKAVELLVAPVSDRLLAGIVDTALVMLAFVAAAVVVIAATAHPPTGKIALIASGVGLAVFGLLYQFLFLSYAEEGTLGMRYARIALCTFEDDNPSRAQMRQRIPALVMAAVPAGLGLLWAMFDKEHLGWHDRMTRTYQRKY